MNSLSANTAALQVKTSTLKEQWQRVAQRIRAELGDDLYTSWFARMDAEELTEKQLTVSVPTRFLRSWIESHYVSKLTKIAAAEFAGLETVLVRVRIQGEASRAANAALAETARASAPQPERNSAVAQQIQSFLQAERAQRWMKIKRSIVLLLAHQTNWPMPLRCAWPMPSPVRHSPSIRFLFTLQLALAKPICSMPLPRAFARTSPPAKC